MAPDASFNFPPPQGARLVTRTIAATSSGDVAHVLNDVATKGAGSPTHPNARKQRLVAYRIAEHPSDKTLREVELYYLPCPKQ